LVPVRFVELHQVSFNPQFIIILLGYLLFVADLNRPEQLWLLNPKKILKRLDITVALEVNRGRSAEDPAPKTQGLILH
jgi:hypothetical protein